MTSDHSEPQALDQIRDALLRALPLRVPIFNPSIHPREKVEKLEDYLGKCAVARGDCEEGLFWAWEAEKVLRDRWETVEGWEPFLPSKARSKPTEAQVTRAKAKVLPEEYVGLREVKTLIAALERQCKRLQRDEETVSRRYTLLTGA